jgi:hypothetical protein
VALSEYLPLLEDLRRRGSRTAGPAALELAVMITTGQAIGEALLTYETAGARRIGVAYQTVIDLVDRLEAFVAAYFGDLDFPPELFIDARQAQRHLSELDVLRRAFAAQRALTAGTSDDQVALDGRPLVPYRLRQGDTLERMALRFLGDVTRGWDIIELNGLQYPFLDTARPLRPAEYEETEYSEEFLIKPSADRRGVADGVRVTGEVILLPADASVPATTTVATDGDVELYGRDILVQDGVVQLGDDGDLVTVEGVPNIEQALLQRLGTGKGELVLHPDYGLEHLLAVGVEGTRANTITSGLEVARAIMQDPRVTAVRHLEILFADTVNSLSMRVALIGPGERTLPMNQVVPGLVGAG